MSGLEGKPASRWRRSLSISIPVAVSAGLVAWILYKIPDLDQVVRRISGALFEHPLFLLAIVPVCLASHGFRASRWRRMLGGNLSLFYCFTSVMLGYSVNLVVPRGGEVARIVNMHRTTEAPVAHLVATVIAERIIDVVVLVAFLGLAILIDGPRIADAFPALFWLAPAVFAASALSLSIVIWMVYAPAGIARLSGGIAGRFGRAFGTRVEAFVAEGARGLASMKEPRQAGLAIFETLAIWILYWAAMILGLAAFDLFPGLGFGGGTVSFAITSCAVMVPSLGSLGPYHEIGLSALTGIYAVPVETALGCMTVLHAIQFILVGGFLGLLIWLLQPFVRPSGRLAK